MTSDDYSDSILIFSRLLSRLLERHSIPSLELLIRTTFEIPCRCLPDSFNRCLECRFHCDFNSRLSFWLHFQVLFTADVTTDGHKNASRFSVNCNLYIASKMRHYSNITEGVRTRERKGQVRMEWPQNLIKKFGSQQETETRKKTNLTKRSNTDDIRTILSKMTEMIQSLKRLERIDEKDLRIRDDFLSGIVLCSFERLQFPSFILFGKMCERSTPTAIIECCCCKWQIEILFDSLSIVFARVVLLLVRLSTQIFFSWILKREPRDSESLSTKVFDCYRIPKSK